ncbi:ATP synthase subunit b cyanelle [Bienertia sinuspersici]
MLSTYLDLRCDPNTSNILEFQMEVVNFDWKSSIETNEYGVYAMIHMLWFEGSSFICEDLKKERKKQEEEENAEERKNGKEDKVKKSKQQQNKENVKKREKLKECKAKKTS